MADTDGGDGSQGMSINDALKEVLRSSRTVDGLSCGIREAVKTLDKRQALVCVLAKNCNESGYVRLIEGLCNEHHIGLLRVEDKEELGEWVGLCKIDKEGKPRKIVKCSCVVVKEFTDTIAWEVVQEYIKTKQAATA